MSLGTLITELSQYPEGIHNYNFTKWTFSKYTTHIEDRRVKEQTTAIIYRHLRTNSQIHLSVIFPSLFWPLTFTTEYI